MQLLSDQQILDADLLGAMGLASDSDEDRSRIVNNVVTLTLKTAMLKILDDLSEEKKKELAGIIEHYGAESKEVTEFLQNNVPNLADILQSALVTVKRDLIARSQKK